MTSLPVKLSLLSPLLLFVVMELRLRKKTFDGESISQSINMPTVATVIFKKQDK